MRIADGANRAMSPQPVLQIQMYQHGAFDVNMAVDKAGKM